MVTATKNGHTHEFTPEVWERMGTGNTRMGWQLTSGDAIVPVEVQVLKEKTEQPSVQATPEVVAEKSVQKKEDAVADNVEEAPKKKKKKA